MNITNIRENILAAKEKRAFLREQFAASGKASLSLTLNIPGYPKHTPLFSVFFNRILSELSQYLQARRILLDRAHELQLTDDAGQFYLAHVSGNLPIEAIKALCEDVEEGHPLGRIIDIDLTDGQGQPVSSGKLKRCLLCDRPAIECMREQRHAYQELRKGIAARITAYLRRQREDALCKNLAESALKAMLYEIAVSPKPGLVDRFDTGAHQDMDYFTFLSSSAALAGYFEDFARSGMSFDDDDLTNALPLVRDTGLKMEQAMFEATGGVNTHKGLIFLMGLSIFAAASVLSRHEAYHETAIRKTISGICRDLVCRELGGLTQEISHGAQCFQHYGKACGGARQEAEEGLPNVFEHGLPTLRSRLSAVGCRVTAAEVNDAMTQTLLSLMAEVDDTNILYRANRDILDQVKQLARRVLAAESEEARSASYAGLIDFCRQKRVSPGGSADLLAVTIFWDDVERRYAQAKNVPR